MNVDALSPAEAAGYRIIDSLDEDMQTKLYDLAANALPTDVVTATWTGNYSANGH